jgi:DNA-binding MarR family transcriptional regulator
MKDDFSTCLLMNTVMAARAMTRRYDQRLKPFGISVAQFAVLGTVRRHKDETVSEMAEKIAMDRTTLLRNLDLLIRKRLVAAQPAPRGSGRIFSLTAEGDRLLDEVIPVWRATQVELRELLDAHEPDELLGALKTLTAG